MVLMQARDDLAFPDPASPDLIGVAALEYQDITCPQAVATHLLRRGSNRLDLREIEIASLNVSCTKIRNLKARSALCRSLRNARLNDCELRQECGRVRQERL